MASKIFVCYCDCILQVKFNESVQWMTLEFDPRTGFAQAEDKIGDLLIPHKPATLASPVKSKQANTPPVVTPCLMSVGFDSVYEDWERFALEYPPGLVLLPGVFVISLFTPRICPPSSMSL